MSSALFFISFTVVLQSQTAGAIERAVSDGVGRNFTLAGSPAHSVSGTVTSIITGLPLSEATVTILDTELPPAMTDADGMYLFPSVPDGTYDIQASWPGFLSSTQAGVVIDQDSVVDFALDSLAMCDHIPGNLVRNCSFQTGDFYAWTLSGDTSFMGISCFSGRCGLYAGPTGGLGFIAQNLATTPNTSYSICYLLRTSGQPNEVQVRWGGTVIWDEINIPDHPFMQFCLNAVADSDTTEIKFGFFDPPDFISFEEVSVAPVAP